MDEAQQGELDQQVQEAMQELGETASVESIARRVGRRTETVLHAIKRVTGLGTSEPDVDTSPQEYPAVVEAARKVEAITAALQDTERTLQARETALVRAEAAAAEALLDSRAPISLIEARQAVLDAAEMARLLALAQSTAKSRYDDALAQAQAQHWALQWRRYQEAVQAFDEALAVAYTAQTEAMRWWNLIGQPQEPPLLKAALAVFPDHFHGFLQGILDMPPEQVQRGTTFAGVHPQPRAY
jgi:hypothetical protein